MDRAELKDRTFLGLAKQLGQLGTCPRKAVGCIITRERRAVSWGYNSAPPGLPHCEESICGWESAAELAGKILIVRGVRQVRELDVIQEGLYRPKEDAAYVEGHGTAVGLIFHRAAEKFGCRNTSHAELNAVAFAARQGISTEGGTCFVGVAPCLDCARILIAAGLSRVVFEEPYWDTSGVDLLRQAGVDLASYDPA